MALSFTPQDLDLIERIKQGLLGLPKSVKELGRGMKDLGRNTRFLYEQAKLDTTKTPLTEGSLIWGPNDLRTFQTDETGKTRSVSRPIRPEEQITTGEIARAPEEFWKGKENRLNQAIAKDLEDTLMANFIGGGYQSLPQLQKEAVTLAQRFKGAGYGAVAFTALSNTIRRLYGEEVNPQTIAEGAIPGLIFGSVMAKPGGGALTAEGQARARLSKMGFKMSDFGNPKAMQARYRQVASQIHPDTVIGRGGTAEEVAQANQAFAQFANDVEAITSIKTPTKLGLADFMTWAQNAWKQATAKPSKGGMVTADEGSGLAQQAQKLGEMVTNLMPNKSKMAVVVPAQIDQITPDQARQILNLPETTNPDDIFNAFRSTIRTAVQNPKEFGAKIGLPNATPKQLTKVLSVARQKLQAEAGVQPEKTLTPTADMGQIEKRISEATKTFTEAKNWLQEQTKYMFGVGPSGGTAEQMREIHQMSRFAPGVPAQYPLMIRPVMEADLNDAKQELAFGGFTDFSTKTLEAMKGLTSVSKTQVFDKMKELKVNPIEKEIVQLVLDRYPDNKKLPMNLVANEVRSLLPILHRRALSTANYGPGDSYYYPQDMSGENYQIILLESQFPHGVPRTHFMENTAVEPFTKTYENIRGVPSGLSITANTTSLRESDLREKATLPNLMVKSIEPGKIQATEFGHIRLDEVRGGPGNLKTGRAVEFQSDIRQKAGKIWKAYLDPEVRLPRLNLLLKEKKQYLANAIESRNQAQEYMAQIPMFRKIYDKEGLVSMQDSTEGLGSNGYTAVVQDKFKRKAEGRATPTDLQWNYLRDTDPRDFDLYEAKDNYMDYLQNHYSPRFTQFLNNVYNEGELESGTRRYIRNAVGSELDDYERRIDEYKRTIDLLETDIQETTNPGGIRRALDWYIRAYQNRRHLTRMLREFVKYNAEKGMEASEVPSPEMGMRIEYGSDWATSALRYYNQEQLSKSQGYIPKDIKVGQTFKWTNEKSDYSSPDNPIWTDHRNYLVLRRDGDNVIGAPEQSSTKYLIGDARNRLAEFMGEDYRKMYYLGKLPVPIVKELTQRIGIDLNMRVVDFIKEKLSESEKYQMMFHNEDDPMTMLELYKKQPSVFSRYIENLRPEQQLGGASIMTNLRDIAKRRTQRMNTEKLAMQLTDIYANTERTGSYDRYIWIAGQDDKYLWKVNPQRFTSNKAGTGVEIKEVADKDFKAPDHLPKSKKAIWENYQAVWDAMKEHFGGEVISAHEADGSAYAGTYTLPNGDIKPYTMLWYKHRPDEVKQPVFTFGSMVFMLPAVAELIRQQYQRLDQRQSDENQAPQMGLPAQPPVLQ